MIYLGKRVLIVMTFALIQSVAYAAGPAKTPTERVNLRIRQQLAQIQREEHLGKLTKDQAKSLKAQVGTIRKTEVADLKANNSKTLTDDQVNQLNQQLNTLSRSIPIK